MNPEYLLFCVLGRFYLFVVKKVVLIQTSVLILKVQHPPYLFLVHIVLLSQHNILHTWFIMWVLAIGDAVGKEEGPKTIAIMFLKMMSLWCGRKDGPRGGLMLIIIRSALKGEKGSIYPRMREKSEGEKNLRWWKCWSSLREKVWTSLRSCLHVTV